MQDKILILSSLTYVLRVHVNIFFILIIVTEFCQEILNF